MKRLTEGHLQEWSQRLNLAQHEKLTRSRHGKDSQIDSSFFVFSVVVHGRFFVDGVLCLVHPVNDRVFSLPNRVNSFLNSANYFFYAVTVYIFFELFTDAVRVSHFSELLSYAATVFPRNYFCINILWKGTREGCCLSCVLEEGSRCERLRVLNQQGKWERKERQERQERPRERHNTQGW